MKYLILFLLIPNLLFATIIPTRSTDGKIISHTAGLPIDDNVRLRFIGTHDFTIAPMATASQSWTIPQLTYGGENVSSFFRGGSYKIVGGCDGDKVAFEVTDPSNNVVEQFGLNWHVFKDEVNHVREHRATLPPTYKIKITYQSTCLVGARFIFNLFRYIETP